MRWNGSGYMCIEVRDNGFGGLWGRTVGILVSVELNNRFSRDSRLLSQHFGRINGLVSLNGGQMGTD